ncbi:hypothetical protein CSUB01_02149 [Colletotrichum sublineola]|uniref:Uncharacterized protein n=1 Tax=Colletotrichum sublineola TaxID=1173701 RepID=A0A066XBV5_COLSU|nr:hypothetical protein CSUB01_02149 [Colletotrichum sublineola]
MPSSHAFSMDNNAGSHRPTPNEKPSRDLRLERFNNDKAYDLAHRVHSGEPRPQSLDGMLGQHLANLPPMTTNRN